MLYEERLTRPAWHAAIALAALPTALGGAVLITHPNPEIEMPSGASPVGTPADGAASA